MQYGAVVVAKRDEIVPVAQQLRRRRDCVSNDAHVIALAQVTGARLLFSNDSALQSDFKNKLLIDQPRGKVYSTTYSKNVTRMHRQLLNDPALCKIR